MKLTATLSTLLLLLSQGLAWGQLNQNWTTTSGSTGTDYGNSIAHDALGNVYTTGRFANSVDFDNGPGSVVLTSNGGTDAFITKQDPSGNLIWAKSIGGTADDFAYSIELDASNNVVIGGHYKQTVDFDPGAGISTLSIPGGSTGGGFVLKLDSNGSFLWVKEFQATWSQVLRVAIDANSNIIVSGSFTISIDLDPGAGGVGGTTPQSTIALFVVKLDAAGIYVWGGAAPGNGTSTPYSVQLNAAGDVYVTGQFTNTFDFNFGAANNSLSSAGAEDVFLLKMNSSGVYQWAQKIGSTGTDAGRDLNVDASGNIYLIGYFNGTVDFDPSAAATNMSSAGAGDVFISKYDAAGLFLWAKRVGGTGDDLALAIDEDSNGDLYMTGRFSGTVDFDPNAGVANQTSNGSTDGYLLWLNSVGQHLDVEAFGGAGAETGFSVTISGTDYIFLTGSYEQTVNFDPTGPGLNATSNGGLDHFVTRYRTCFEPNQPVVSVGNSQVCIGSNETYSVTSVPTAVFYTWTLPAGWSGTSTTQNITTVVGANGGTISVTATNSCGTSLPAVVSVSASSVPTITGSDVTICANTTANLSVSTTSGTIEWYDMPTGGTLLGTGLNYTTGVLTTNTSFYAEAINGCANNPRFEVNVLVTQIPVVTGNDVTICINNSTDLSVTTTSGTIEWFDSPTGGNLIGTGSIYTTPVLTGLSTYYVQATDNGCVTDPRLPITVYINYLPEINPEDTTICAGNDAELEVYADFGTVEWFDSPTGGTSLATGLQLTTGPLFTTTTFYIETANSACVSDPRYEINVFVNPIPDLTLNYNGTSITSNQTGASYQWLDCNNGNSIIPGAQSQEYILPQNGTYAVEVNLNSCVDTSACELIDDLSISPIENAEFTIYPNPTTDVFNIAFQKGIYGIEAYSISGQLIFEKPVNGLNEITIQMNVAPGVYLISILDESGKKLPLHRIVIQ